MNAIGLPPDLADALDEIGRGPGSTAAHRRAAQELSDRYRAGASSAAGHVVRDDTELGAYAVARFPATYAAAVAAFTATAAALPDFAPTSLLDVGAGLGATACAALAVWPSLVDVACVEPDPRAATAGRGVVDALGRTSTWTVGRAGGTVAGRSADLVTAGYVGNELANPAEFARVLWAATTGVLVLLEPGTHPASHALLASRDALLDRGAVTAAPCPHDDRCPLQRSDWCHFGQRLPRTAAHRQLKGADLPYEDEKYSYVAMSRTPVPDRASRVIRRPSRRKGLVELTLCEPGGVQLRRVPRSAPGYRAAKDVGWGDAWPVASP